MTTTRPRDRAPVELAPATRLRILVAVLLGIFLAALDQTVVGTALPVGSARQRRVHVGVHGVLVDGNGQRANQRQAVRHLRAAPGLHLRVGTFLAGLLLCGLSQDIAMFIGFRGLQGLGAGAMFPILGCRGGLDTRTANGRDPGG